MTPSETRAINQKAIENEGSVMRIEGAWWQFSLTERTAKEPSALSLLKGLQASSIGRASWPLDANAPQLDGVGESGWNVLTVRPDT